MEKLSLEIEFRKRSFSMTTDLQKLIKLTRLAFGFLFFFFPINNFERKIRGTCVLSCSVVSDSL